MVVSLGVPFFRVFTVTLKANLLLLINKYFILHITVFYGIH